MTVYSQEYMSHAHVRRTASLCLSVYPSQQQEEEGGRKEGGGGGAGGGMRSQNSLCDDGAIPVVTGIACLWHCELTVLTPSGDHSPKIAGRECIISLILIFTYM